MLNKADLRDIVRLGIELSAEKNKNKLFEKLLRTAMDISGCDAGTLYLFRDGKLYFNFLNKEMPAGVTMLVDGAKGAVKIKPISTFTVGFVLILITLLVVLNLVNSRTGRAIQATRDNRIAAESMGVSVTRYKMIAFVTAAVLAGMAGALYGLNSSTVVPTQFTFNQSINVLGSVISATFLTVLPEVLREFADYRMLVYAVVLILVMIFTNNPMIRSLEYMQAHRVYPFD